MIQSYDTKTLGRRWRVRTYNAETGTWENHGSYSTKREAKKAEAEAIAERKPDAGGGDGPTIAEWKARWLKRSAKRNKESTVRWQDEQTRAFVRKYGEWSINAFPRRLAIAWAEEHRAQAQPLSAMWTDAINAEVIDTESEEGGKGQNVWRGLIEQRGRQIDPGWLTEDDIGHFAAAAQSEWPGPYGLLVVALIMAAAYCGLRPGELAGLRWIDLDAENDRIHVRQQAESRTRQLTPPKNGLSRTIVYPKVVQRAIAAISPMDDDLVFVGPRGAVLFASNRDRVWGRVRARAGRETELHELRHWCATWLVEQGLSASDVAIQLGHTDGGALVETTYGHARPDPALKRVAALLATAKDHNLNAPARELTTA